MSFQGFTQSDFDVFTIPGLEARMEALIARVRPKLHEIGNQINPFLSTLCTEEMHPHVARHARRKVNPPHDTWVAWSNSKKGYKAHPHFQVGLWQTHLFVWFALIYESPLKIDFAHRALPEVSTIKQTIPDHYQWSIDHTKPEAKLAHEVSEEELSRMLEQLYKVKKSEILCGIHIDRNDPILHDGQALQERILDTFKTLVPLYKLVQSR